MVGVTGVAWHGVYEEAVAEAGERERPILIMFEAPG